MIIINPKKDMSKSTIIKKPPLAAIESRLVLLAISVVATRKTGFITPPSPTCETMRNKSLQVVNLSFI